MNPASQPIDAFKTAVAQLVASAWEDDAAKIVQGVDTGKKGADLALAIPRFKKGKPDEWAKKVLDAVSLHGCPSEGEGERPCGVSVQMA